LAILEKSPFESSHSIAERLLIAQSKVLWHLHESIEFKSFHLRWVPHLLSRAFSKNERSRPKIYCHSCMLPNVIAGIILWLVMSHGFFDTLPHWMWTLSTDDVGTKPRQQI
jgi:hypothetical protein